MTERLHFHFSLSCIGEGNGKLGLRESIMFLPPLSVKASPEARFKKIEKDRQ